MSESQISLICSIASLVVAIVIAIVEFFQNRRMNKLAIKQDEESREIRRQNIKSQRDSFIMKYKNDENEIYFLPLCWIASIYDSSFAYSRKMYMEFNMLEQDVQDAILDKMGLYLERPNDIDDDFFQKCLEAVEVKEMELKPIGPRSVSVFYDYGKYLTRGLKFYNNVSLPENAHRISRNLMDKLSEYDENQYAGSPIEDFKTEFHFATCDESYACFLCSLIARDISMYGNDTPENLWIPGTHGGETIETMEDLFLCALYCIYIFLIYKKENGEMYD